jgi:hypothetical protein
VGRLCAGFDAYSTGSECEAYQQLLLRVAERCPNVQKLLANDELKIAPWGDTLLKLVQGFQRLTELVITDLDLSQQELCAVLRHCKYLETLSIRDEHQHLSGQIALPTLRSLEIYSRHMSDAVMVAIGQRCTRLELLKVFESQLKFHCDYPITDVGVLAVLQGCPLLRETDVENAARIGTGLRAGLAQRCNFSRIDWSKWAGLSDALAQGVLVVSPNLVAVEFKECKQLTDATLAVCAQHCPRLETVIMVWFGVTNLGIRALAKGAAYTLREIRIAGYKQLGDDAVFAIAKLCVRLDFFTLRECPLVTGNAVRALVTKRGHLLETLLIYDGPALDDATVLTIAEHCPRLRCFNCFIPASDAAVAILRKRCVHLQWDPAAERLTFRGKVTSVVLLFLWLTALLFFFVWPLLGTDLALAVLSFLGLSALLLFLFWPLLWR